MRKEILLLFAVGAAFFYSESYAQQSETMRSWEESAIEYSVDMARIPGANETKTGYFLVFLKEKEGLHALEADKLQVHRKGEGGTLS